MSIGFIYAAKEVDAPLFKIGSTAGAVDRRLARISLEFHTTFSCVFVVPVTATMRVTIEAHVHDILKAQRVEREFFYLHMNQRALEVLVARACNYAEFESKLNTYVRRKLRRLAADRGYTLHATLLRYVKEGPTVWRDIVPALTYEQMMGRAKI